MDNYQIRSELRHLTLIEVLHKIDNHPANQAHELTHQLWKKSNK